MRRDAVMGRRRGALADADMCRADPVVMVTAAADAVLFNGSPTGVLALAVNRGAGAVASVAGPGP